MPTLSKVRFTNLQYDGGNKRYQDEMFHFDGHNGALLLENGGGKTVFIQSVIQCVLPNSSMAKRQMRDTLEVGSAPAHLAVEWILEESPREYAVTCVTFFMGKDGLDYYMYCFDYREGSPHAIEEIPFVKATGKGKRPVTKEEILEYYQEMQRQYGSAQLFETRRDYQRCLEEQYRIVPSEWEAMLKINASEGGVDDFFDGCKTMTQLVDKLLIPTVEQGLAVNGAEDFYQLFDNHRGHIREYLSLGEQLKEYHRIDERLRELVGYYNSYDLETRAYREWQGKGKTLWQRMGRESEQLGNTLADLGIQQETLKQEEQGLHERKAGVEVWKKQAAYEAARSEYQRHEPFFQQVQEKERKSQVGYRSLQYLGLKQDEEEAEGQIRISLDALERMERDVTTEELATALDLLLRQAAFLFKQNEAALQSAQREAEQDVFERERVVADHHQKLKLQHQEQERLIKEESKLAERSHSLQSQMDEIEGSILFNRQQDRVPQEVEGWERRTKQIENGKLDALEQQKRVKEKLSQLKGQMERAIQERDAGKARMEQARLYLEGFEGHENGLVEELSGLIPEFGDLTSMQQKEETIRHRLEAELVLLGKKVEDAFTQERVAYRFYDLYHGSQTFSADPELERWVKSLQIDLPSAELGTSYALRVAREGEEDLDKLYDVYPLWPMTIVAAGSELEKVKGRLEGARHLWTHPVHLITTAQAQSFRQGVWEGATCLVTPSQWLSLTEQHSFEAWLEEQKQLGNETEQQRKYFEGQRRRFELLFDKVKGFYRQYPFEKVKEWREQKDSGERTYRSARSLLEELDGECAQAEAELRRLASALMTLEQESQDLSRRIDLGYKWMRLEDQLHQVKDRLARVEGELEAGRIAENQILQAIDVVGSEIEQFRATIGRLQVESGVLKQNSLYVRTASLPMAATEESLPVLQARIDELDDQLHGVTAERRRWETARDEWKRRLAQLQRAKEAHLSEYGHLVDVEYQHSGDVQSGIQANREIWQTAKELFHQVNTYHDQLREGMKKAEQAVQMGRAVFQGRFRKDCDLSVFGTQSVEVVEEQLERQADVIRDRLQQCKGEAEAAQKLLQEVEGVLNQLDVLSRMQVHGFADADVLAVPLEEEEEQRFPYARMKFVKELERRLDEQVKRVKETETKVHAYRQQFQKDLEGIQEERIRQQTLDGLRMKTTYREVQEWSDLMHERILGVVNIVEQQQRESDQQIQHLISYLHTHIRNICRELHEIPKMTKVRFAEGGVREIFDFTVPEWKEEEGLLQLRKHLEWMMTALEQDKYKNSLGQEDQDKVRKQVQEWLHPTQLLHVINSANEIKVSCRKVTNDNKVAGSYTPWPETENWSGGEKWSKNMTLMLGILNYLAEKRGHLRAGKGNHRVVICDNPFGKASSDHVLGPVFHIAKQLGFQILALTAHADGKFLRDYFPILYSCQLRQTADPSVQVMYKEKEIRKAYFQDRFPQSLERLGESEQLSMMF